jgi:hypothetical protein
MVHYNFARLIRGTRLKAEAPIGVMRSQYITVAIGRIVP